MRPLKTIKASRAGWGIFLITVFCSDKPAQASCSVERCDDRQFRRDQSDYVLQEVQLDGQCCPDFRKLACRHGGNIYQVRADQPNKLKYFDKITDWRLVARPGPVPGLHLRPERGRGGEVAV